MKKNALLRVCWFAGLNCLVGIWPAAFAEKINTNTSLLSPEALATGEEVYRTVCAACHETGVPKAPVKGMLGFMSTASIYHALTEGVMAPRVPQLNLQQKKAVAEYLTGQPLSTEKPKAFPQCQGESAQFDGAQVPAVVGWGAQPQNTRVFDAEATTINPSNIQQLDVAWAFGFPDAVRARSHPAIGGDAVFVGSQDGRVFALDKTTGCVRWSYRAKAEVRTAIILSSWDKNDKTAQPGLYFGDYLGNVYALDARTGKLRWQVRPDAHPSATITGSPTLFKNRLYVPVSSLEVLAAADPDYACCTFRGSVVAFDTATGEKVWQTYTIAERPNVRGKNSAGTDRVGPSGAPIWNSPATDAKRNQLLVGTGENYSRPTTETSDAIIAMDLDQGKINWVFQATANDAWNSACEMADQTNCPQPVGPDYDFGAPPILATHSDGSELVLAGQKSGIVWALAPDTGKLLWQRQVSKGGLVGGIHFGMAVSGDTVFVPISDAQESQHHAPRKPNPGLFALDIKTGRYQWQWHAVTGVCGDKPYCMPGNGAAISTTPELVFAGSLDGYIRAHDTRTGKVLWQFNTAKDFTTVNGVKAFGGALEGGASAALDGDMMFLNSGYFFNPYMPGNVFIAFKLAEAPAL